MRMHALTHTVVQTGRHTVTSLSAITSVEMRAVWKNGAEHNGDCVGNRVNRVSVQAGGRTNNGFVSDAGHGAEICQTGSGMECVGCGLEREENSLRAPLSLVLESESHSERNTIFMFSSQLPETQTDPAEKQDFTTSARQDCAEV